MHKSLTNFNAPDATRKRFDAICHAIGRTRTSVLVELMTDFILAQSQLLATKNQQFKVIDELLLKNSVLTGIQSSQSDHTLASPNTLQSRSNQDFGPIPIRYSDGQEEW
jgi:predicted transcriptional regulator